MAQSGKNESRKRSRAITAIVKVIGRYDWNKLSTNEKNKKIKDQISKTKKEAKEGRKFMQNLNKKYKGILSEASA